MIYSITMFGDIPNERNILKLRMEEELPFIDKMIIVECDRTDVGTPKPYGLKSMPSVTRHPKIECKFVVAPFYEVKQMYYEHRMNYCMRTYADDDVIIHSDLDEVNDRRDMPNIIQSIRKLGYIHLSIYNHSFYINYFARNWQRRVSGGFGCTGKYLRTSGLTFSQLRGEWNPNAKYRHPILYLNTTGHHLSYMLTPEQISNKISNASDVCFNQPENNNLEFIRGAIANGWDILNRSGKRRIWSIEPVNNRYPAALLNNLELWRPFIAEKQVRRHHGQFKPLRHQIRLPKHSR